MKRLLIGWIVFCLCGSPVFADHSWKAYCVDSRTDLPVPPQLSHAEINTEFARAELGFVSRWAVFSHCHGPFVPFSLNKSDQVLEEEFEHIQNVRFDTWFVNPNAQIKQSAPGYEIAQSLLFQDGARARNCIAFSYNNTTPFYNASTMRVGSFVCIACEGPRSKDVDRFLQLLVNYQVSHIVRLTPAYDGELKKCHPYWETHSQVSEGNLFIPVGGDVMYPVRTFALENWKDHQGTDVDELLQLVLQVKRELEASGGLLAVHCSAGVGRTGTFLAALAIVDAIDRGEQLSIEEIVYRLSLQRFQCVAKLSQYIVLHRLAEKYLLDLSKNSE